jgi:hypothetical protein
MALVSKSIPNLINGVSQQPAALRLESQGEVQENGFSDVVDGLKKRPPTKFENKLRSGNPISGTHLTETELSTAFFHTYKRSDEEQYQVVMTSVPVAGYTAPVTHSTTGTHSSFSPLGGSAYPRVMLVTSPSAGTASQAAQTVEINITSLPTGGGTFYQIGRTNANGQWFFSGAIALTLGLNTISVPAVSFNRSFNIKVSSTDIHFSSLKINNTFAYQAPAPDLSGSHTKKIYVYDIKGNLRYESGVASWNEDGIQIAPNTDNIDYLPNDLKEVATTSVADATFIVNKKQTVAMSDVINPANDLNQALVYLKSVNYARNYMVKVTSKELNDGNGNPQTADGYHLTVKQITTSSGNDDTTNSEALKVSSVISRTKNGNTSLREEVEADLGSAVLKHFQQVNAVGQGINAFDVTVPASMNLTTSNAEAGKYVVQVGGATVPYRTNFSSQYVQPNGWEIVNSTTIRLPYYVVQIHGYMGSFGSNPIQLRPEGKVVYTPANATIHGFVSPQSVSTGNNQPYFIINTPNDSGNIRDFNIEVTDDDGGVNLKAFKGNAKSFTDLPNQCEKGFRLGVVGDNQKKEDDFHVVFEGDTGSGFWKETVAYNLKNYYDLATMPHTLKQNADLSFSFAQGEWDERKAGDDNTNPTPSFVGSTISDIFFHRNRLGVLAGENVIFSEASGYYNFWRTTVRTLLDSDPIDVAVSQNEVSELKAAVPIQDNLLLFSNLNQFTLSASQLLTPAEVTVDQSTKYECDLTAPPVGAGNSVFFATKSGGFAGVREFFTRDDTEIKDAVEITSHVPSYIQGGIRDIQASSNKDMLIVLSDTNKNECYVYKWYNSSQERLQSSWSKWAFHNGKVASGNLIPKNIASVAFNNADLFFTFEDGSYEKMELSEIVSPVLLDNQLTVVPTDATYTALPTNVAAHLTNRMVVITEEGINLGLAQDAANLNKILNSLNDSKTLIFGEPYTFKYQLSEQVFKPVQGDSTKLARFQLRKLAFNYSNTGTFKVTVDSVGRDPTVSTFTGRLLGQEDNILGTATVVPEGSFPVGIQSQADKTNITITNDTHLPSTFQSAEWEGFVTLRNQRL